MNPGYPNADQAISTLQDFTLALNVDDREFWHGDDPTSLLCNANLITQQHFCGAAFPTTVSARREHVFAGWVDMEG